MRVRESERGAALFAVLAMVMLLASFAALGLSRLRAATDRVSDADARAEAQLLANAGANAGISIVNRLKARARAGGPSLDEPVAMEFGSSKVVLKFSDGGNCFNLNSLSRPRATVSTGEQKAAASPTDFARLLGAAGIPLTEADTIAKATAARLGSSGVLWADGSEWTTVTGVTARHWQLAGRFLCALPDRGTSLVNVNSLTADQAPLLAAMGLGTDEARRAIAGRPATGWSSSDDFLRQSLTDTEDNPGVGEQLGTTSRWMRLTIEATTPRARVTRELVIDSIRQPARVVQSRWRAVEVAA